LLVVRESAPALDDQRSEEHHAGEILEGIMDKKTLMKMVGALLLVVFAGFLAVRAFRGEGGDSDGTVYFYDLSEQRLFPAPRASVPPIRGLHGDEADGVRAIVISDSGNRKHRKRQRIAYLEKYAPELKAQFEALRQSGATKESSPGTLRREEVPAKTLVRRLTDTKWHAMNTPEGEKIVSEWNVPGPDGAYPAVCVP
jgi:hypothetical protein